MSAATSVLRSLARIASEALPGYQVATSGQAGSWSRPFCAVVTSTGVATRPTSGIEVQRLQSYTIAVYVEQGMNVDADAHEARRVRDALSEHVLVGAVPGRPHPGRLPVWDYEQIPLFEPATGDPVVYARIEAGEFDAVEDREHLWTVVGDVRVSWRESVRRPAAGTPVTRVGMRRTAA